MCVCNWHITVFHDQLLLLLLVLLSAFCVYFWHCELHPPFFFSKDVCAQEAHPSVNFFLFFLGGHNSRDVFILSNLFFFIVILFLFAKLVGPARSRDSCLFHICFEVGGWSLHDHSQGFFCSQGGCGPKDCTATACFYIFGVGG